MRVEEFLCHKSADKPDVKKLSDVKKLYKALKEDGFDPWLDAANLLPARTGRGDHRRREGVARRHRLLSNTVADEAGFAQEEIEEIKMALGVSG